MEFCPDSGKSSKTISHMIGLAMKRKVSWTLLSSFLEEMSSTLDESKQIIRILLEELKNQNLSKEEYLIGGVKINSMNPTRENKPENKIFEFEKVEVISELEHCDDSLIESDNGQDDSFDENYGNDDEIIEVFKNQLYTFVENDKESLERESSNRAFDQDEETHAEVKEQVDSIQNHDNSNRNPLKCETCGKIFKKRMNLRKHEQIHTGLIKPFKCSKCTKCFKSINYLKKHEKTHSGEKSFKCSSCEKCYLRSDHLKVHEKIHTGEMSFSCETCFKGFKTSSELRRHIRTHTGEKPFSCKDCKKSFTTSGHLKQHGMTHSGERPFQCKVCNKAFIQIGNLKIHERGHIMVKSHLFAKPVRLGFTKSANLNRQERSHIATSQSNL